VSLAIGKGGLNIRLASQLTGYEIDVYRETDGEDDEDVNLEEFADEIEGWVLDELKNIGCDTAKSVLNLTIEDLVKRIKDTLGERVKDVRVTHRLTSSPACLVADQDDISANLERVLKSVGQDVPGMKPILEINPEHPMVTALKAEQDAARFGDWSTILFEQALLSEGGQLDDPAGFVSTLNKLMLDLMGERASAA